MARVVWSRLRVVKEKFGDRASVASGCDHRDASHGASCVCTRIVDDPVRAIGPPPTVGDLAPDLAGMGAVGLVEGLADCGGGDAEHPPGIAPFEVDDAVLAEAVGYRNVLRPRFRSRTLRDSSDFGG